MKLFKDIKFNTTLFFISVILFLSSFSFSLAATLQISPIGGTYQKGATITANVVVSSPDKAMNAASGVVSFPTDILSVSSISKNGSIVGFWAQEPAFSNTAGTVNFEGVLLPPGYTGGSGKIITITFKAKEAGTANISFSSGSVLAADGIGSEIMLGTGGATYQIGGASEAPVVSTSAEITGTPSAPEIYSSTHPDQNKWYAVNDAKFSWGLPKDVTGSSVLIGKLPKSSPSVLYDPPIGSKEIKNLEDGIWYFHAQLKNEEGWSTVSHYKLQIDTEKPVNFDITEIPRDDQTDPKAKFTFSATDKTSGIDHYEIKIDNNDSEIWKDDGRGIYEAPDLESGVHTLLAKAIDKAGNYIITSAEFNLQALEAPIITEYPTDIQTGDIFTVKGTSKYFESKASMFLQNEKGVIKNYEARVDKDGNFSITPNERITDGVYTAWVQIIDARGAKSSLSEKVTISVRQTPLLRIGTIAISYLAVIIPLLAMIALLTILLWYVWHRFFVAGRKIRKEVREAEDVLHKAFDLLKESVQHQVKLLEKVKTKRKLTDEEEKVNKQLKKDLDDAERFIRKEIEDIEKLIK